MPCVQEVDRSAGNPSPQRRRGVPPIPVCKSPPFQHPRSAGANKRKGQTMSNKPTQKPDVRGCDVTPQELTELTGFAAKAMGLPLHSPGDGWSDGSRLTNAGRNLPGKKWSPHYDDGDSRRLQIACRIALLIYDNAPPELDLPRSCAVAVTPSGQWFAEDLSNPTHAAQSSAACLVVLRAAAAIGKAMP